MVPTMLKRVVACAMLAAWMPGVSGCVSRSEYNAKVADVKDQTEKLAKTKEKMSRLEKDLDATRSEIRQAEQAKEVAEARITTREQENAGLTDQAKKLEQENASLKTKIGEKVSQLQKAAEAAKIDVEKAKQAKKDAEARITTLEQKNAGSMDQVKKLEQENADLKTTIEEKMSQLRKDLDAAKIEVEKATQAKKDAEANIVRKPSETVENLSGEWEITYQKNIHAAVLEALPNNRYRLGPKGLAFSGVYQFDGTTLSMVAENPGYPALVWSMKKPGLLEMEGGNYVGASMKRKVAGGTDVKSSNP